jgi:hypothetical protein
MVTPDCVGVRRGRAVWHVTTIEARGVGSALAQRVQRSVDPKMRGRRAGALASRSRIFACMSRVGPGQPVRAGRSGRRNAPAWLSAGAELPTRLPAGKQPRQEADVGAPETKDAFCASVACHSHNPGPVTAGALQPRRAPTDRASPEYAPGGCRCLRTPRQASALPLRRGPRS